MNNCEIMLADYESLLLKRIRPLAEMIENKQSSHTTRKEFRIYSDIIGEFRKLKEEHRKAIL